MWHYVLPKIWRNLHRDIEIDRNWRSEVAEIKGRSENFHFQGGLALLGGGQTIFIFREGVVMGNGVTQDTFLKSQDKFFFVISMYPFLHIFDT